MKRALLSLTAAIAIMTVAIAPAAAITNNYYPDPDHPFVGLVAFYDKDGEFSHRCTGELLAPTVLLTAGHCTDDGAGGVNASAARLVPAGGRQVLRPGHPARSDHRLPGVLRGRHARARSAPSSTEMYNYGFDNFAGFPNTHDVGVVILEQPIQMPRYAYLAGAGDARARSTAPRAPRTRSSGSPATASASARSRATISYRVRLQAVSQAGQHGQPSSNSGFNIQLNGNGDDRGGTCSGDSGGPVFYRRAATRSWP